MSTQGEDPVSKLQPERISVAEAAARRQHASLVDAAESSQAVFSGDEHDRRQKFRRLINPGITRPNSKETALAALKTLHTIATNLISNPDEDKYHRFKPTNNLIKRNLIDVPGALEYAIALGFRATVDNFQPFYVFSRTHEQDLRIGAAILKETMDVEAEKMSRLEDSRAREKQGVEEALRKVKLNFEEDRREKQLRDALAKQKREALALAGPPREPAAATATGEQSTDGDDTRTAPANAET